MLTRWTGRLLRRIRHWVHRVAVHVTDRVRLALRRTVYRSSRGRHAWRAGGVIPWGNLLSGRELWAID